MRKFFAAAMAFGLLASFGLSASAADVEEGFVSLFNGRDLAGWVKRGGSAEYQVEDGCDRREMRSRIRRATRSCVRKRNSATSF